MQAVCLSKLNLNVCEFNWQGFLIWTWKGFGVCLLHLASDLGLRVSFVPQPVPRKIYDNYDINYLYEDEDGGIEGEEDYLDPDYTIDSEVGKIVFL